MNILIKKVRAILADNSTIELDTELTNTKKGIEIVVIPNKDIQVKEFVIYEGKHFFDKNSNYYGDGYSMLSHYGGSLRRVKNIGAYSDKSHYKMPNKLHFHTAYNYICVFDNGLYNLIGATSCNRFRTEIRTNAEYIEIVQCAENLFFMKDERIKLENLLMETNADKGELFDKYALMIENNHKKKNYKECPVGWCSWYCIGPEITEEKICENIKAIKSKMPELKYIQIDDGYQPHMGDWLDVGDKFTRNMKDICKDIKSQGFEPAMWVAPFIASGESKLFKEHPDYFVKDDNGLPLCSKLVTFQGWRDTPWYFIDGTSEGAIAYIKQVFSTMYNEWGVRYFKLDANVWGAFPFGKRNGNFTSIEAYRRGMEAIWEAVGEDAYILGCNAPMWPSLGLVSGMRVTGDIVRNISWQNQMLEECFSRNWMNNKLWINDPDCLVMKTDNTKVVDAGGNSNKEKSGHKFFKMNTVYVRASGGVIFSGDYIYKYTEDDIKRLRRLLISPRIAAEFDMRKEIGVIKYDNAIEYCLFNRNRIFSKTFNLPVKESKITDMYLGKTIDCKEDVYKIKLKSYESAWLKIEK